MRFFYVEICLTYVFSEMLAVPLYENKGYLINQLGPPTEEFISELDAIYRAIYEANGYELLFQSNNQDTDIIRSLYFYHPFE